MCEAAEIEAFGLVACWHRLHLEAHKRVVKLISAPGAAVENLDKLFNSGRVASVRRAASIGQEKTIDALVSKRLIRTECGQKEITADADP